MSSPGGKAAVGVTALALLVVLFFVLRGADDDSAPSPPTEQNVGSEDGAIGGSASEDARANAGDSVANRDESKQEVPTIVVRGGEPVGGVAELTFTKGERIRFAVTSDVADHVHLHVYDVFKDLPAGGRVSFDVPATIEGVFEVELEDRVVTLAEITVNPG